MNACATGQNFMIGELSMNTSVSRKSTLGVFLAAWSTLLAAIPTSAYAGYGDVLNMPVGVTDISQRVYSLHMTIFWVCCVIGVLVFGVMFYSMFAHRKSKGAKPATFHESTTVEIIWTVVPFIILITMAWPAAKVLIKMEDFSDSEMTVKITGFQWRWHYDYLDEGINYYSQLDQEHNIARAVGSDVDVYGIENYLREVDKPLVLPVGKKIRFLHTAADVIHAWWVPDLSVKKDSIPGFINENWAKIEVPGTYRGKCAELCGRDHGFMPIVVKAVPQDEYDAWVAEQKTAAAAALDRNEKEWTHTELVDAGQRVYQQNCVGCHQAEGQGIPGMFPAIGGSDVAMGDLEKHLDTVLFGVQGTAMQAFGSQLEDADLAAVVTFQRNAFGNATGDTIQPDAIRSYRNGLKQSLLTDSDLIPDLTLTGAN